MEDFVKLEKAFGKSLNTHFRLGFAFLGHVRAVLHTIAVAEDLSTLKAVQSDCLEFRRKYVDATLPLPQDNQAFMEAAGIIELMKEGEPLDLLELVSASIQLARKKMVDFETSSVLKNSPKEAKEKWSKSTFKAMDDDFQMIHHQLEMAIQNAVPLGDDFEPGREE